MLGLVGVWVGSTFVLFVVSMYALAWWSRGRIESAEDFMVAGRRLGFGFTTATVFATWFGAGTLLTASEEVREHGLHKAALDPWGAGACLLIVGLFYARPLYRMGLLTLPDFFARRFGPRSEVVSACLMVPSYFGWIAAQFVALAGLLDVFLGLDPGYGIALVAVVGAGYTFLGGMWSVTVTDAAQVTLLILGLLVLSGHVLATLGDGDWAMGWARFLSESEPERLRWMPAGDEAVAAWVAAFAAGALGNVPGQDLMQRVFSARSAAVAQWGCVTAGVAYIGVGMLPLGLALSLRVVGVEESGLGLAVLAKNLMTPPGAVLFTVVMMSAILSTIDSAILSPASVLSENVLRRLDLRASSLALTRASVVVVTGVSLVFAYSGEDAYAMLEVAYELLLVALLAPLTLGLFTPWGSGASAMASMISGTACWLLHVMLGWDLLFEPWLQPAQIWMPVGIFSAVLGVATYLAVALVVPRRTSLS